MSWLYTSPQDIESCLFEIFTRFKLCRNLQIFLYHWFISMIRYFLPAFYRRSKRFLWELLIVLEHIDIDREGKQV